MTTIKFNDLIVSDQISDRDFSGGHVKRGPQTKSAARPGDWPCPDRGCGNRNFSWRTKCFRCQKPKPVNPIKFRVDAQEFNVKQSNSNAKPGDWTCPTQGCGTTSDFFSKTIKCIDQKP